MMMKSPKDGLLRVAAPFIAALFAWLAAVSPIVANLAAPAGRGAGATFEILQVGKTIYHHVQVRSVTARTLMISHAGGLSSIRLRDLSPELQVAFGYSPSAEAAADATLTAAQDEAEQKRSKEGPARAGAKRAPGNAQFDSLLQNFGQPPEIRPSVDLRPQFLDLALNVKNQGPRPSCAVFAIVSALEFQNAQLSGQAERFSEEYLVWATCKILNRTPRARPDADPAGAETENSEKLDGADEGFALPVVVTALRTYGIPLQSSMPYTFAKTIATADPPRAVLDEARNHRRVSVVPLPGRDQATRLANLIQALDAGIPVAIGLRWPSWRSLRTGYLSGQTPRAGDGHAVTIVGYENKTGAIKDTVFIFKNSWGVKWGAGGYGYATYGYLITNLGDTALLEVEPAPTQNAARRP
ncbi:MAG: hypothetical protein EXS39_02250 [Opitutaceae bacterium]|nr:hypothetical protein [Opitutaceae bacterium]